MLKKFLPLTTTTLGLTLLFAIFALYAIRTYNPILYNNIVSTYTFLGLPEYEVYPMVSIDEETNVYVRKAPPLFWLDEKFSWIQESTTFEGVTAINNPNAYPVWLSIHGHVDIRFETTSIWSSCGPLEGHPGWYQIGSKCSAYLGIAHPESIAVLRHLPPNNP
jgi:hypothetical protein